MNEKPLRILMLSCDYLPNPGGISGHTYELCKALALLGHKIDLIVGHDIKNIDKKNSTLPEGVNIINNIAFNYNWLGYIKYHTKVWFKIKSQLAKENYNLIHWHNLIWESYTVGLISNKIPKIFTNHSSGFLRRAKINWRAKYQLPKILSIANHIITPSSILKSESIRMGFPESKISFIPNGVDTNSFIKKPFEYSHQNFHNTKKTLIVSARLHPIKGVDILLKCFPLVLKEYPNTQIVILGEGDQQEELQQIILKNKIEKSVIFAGAFSRDEMPQMLSLGDFAVLPSRAEAISLSGLEAMSCNLPVIGTKVGGIPQFVKENETGFLAEPEDPNDLSRAILKALNMPDSQYQTMSTKVREYVEETYSWSISAKRVLDSYQKTINQFEEDHKNA